MCPLSLRTCLTAQWELRQCKPAISPHSLCLFWILLKTHNIRQKHQVFTLAKCTTKLRNSNERTHARARVHARTHIHTVKTRKHGYKSHNCTNHKKKIVVIYLKYIYSKSIIRVFIIQTWIADNLKWDPHEFGGVTSIRVPSKDIWNPDILLYNR